ncbi:MAG TPA: hypothetical protein VJA45_08480 [Methylomirabilota bacterium]|nr:hypothetical protein [Methylomirabilota bacterium]
MPGDNHVMLTVLLHHDQAKTLDEIMAHLRKTAFIHLRVEADKVRNLNRYEVFPSYDFAPIAANLKKEHS